VSDDDDTDDVVTINIGDADTITLSDCLSGTDLSYNFDDNMSYSIKTGGTTWYTGDSTYGLDTLSFSDFSPPKEVKVGDRILTEDKIERLDAMLDIFEQDPEFAERLKTQIAFNRIKKDDFKSD